MPSDTSLNLPLSLVHYDDTFPGGDIFGNIQAATSGSVGALQSLLDLGANVSAVDSNEDTALHVSNHIETLSTPRARGFAR